MAPLLSWLSSSVSRRRGQQARSGLVLEKLESRSVLSVTTTFLADPFPNTRPLVFDRSTAVEAGIPTRTPSVVLGQFDVESDRLTVVAHGPAAHGTVTDNADGTFTYLSVDGYEGSDSFSFTIGDGRGGFATGAMNVRVIRADADRPATKFVGMDSLPAIDFGGRTTVVPRAVDFDGDGLVDILAGTAGRVLFMRNRGTPGHPLFATPVEMHADGVAIRVGEGRVALSCVDMDADSRLDLVLVGAGDGVARWYRNVGTSTAPQFAAASILKAADGVTDYVVADIRADVADWNGDGLPDIVTGSFCGAVQIALNVGTANAPAFAVPTRVIDAAGRTLEGAYNLNVRIVDVNRDGVPDFVSSYNWGTINYSVNLGSAARPTLSDAATFTVADTTGATVDFHSLADGAIVDFADLDGDGTIDLVAGGENPGSIRLAFGRSGMDCLGELDAILAAHPSDLGRYLADQSHAGEKERVRGLLGDLYDFTVQMATPSQRAAVQASLLAQIRRYPQYFRMQSLDVAAQPGIPSLAAQTLLTALMTAYDDPATRKAVCDAAGFAARDEAGGGYRTLVEDLGLFLFDNFRSPRGAEAIYQTVRNVPRNVYPGTGITMVDWLGGGDFLVRGHLKNGFNGYPDDGETEYGFGADARAVIGDRGAENWYMTVIHHEIMHDMDAFVRRSPDLLRRWGQMLVYAGGHDASGVNYLAADPATGWFSEPLTRTLWLEQGRWNGTDEWGATFKAFYETGAGKPWNDYGFMRGGIHWFLGAPQESLATQGNQFWNSGEGRIEVALDRWRRGFDSDITEVLFFMDVLSQGLDKMQVCENDGFSDRVISYAQLHRDASGHIDRVIVNGRDYRFTVNREGRVTSVDHPTAPPAAVTHLVATAGSCSEINLSWVDNATTESGYVLERATSPAFTGTLVPFILPAGSTMTKATGLAAGTSYFFRIRARNAAGDSANSATALAKTPLNLGGFSSAVDIGGAVPTGSTSFTDPIYTVRAGGIGIAGVADRFHFASSTVSGDAEIIVRVASLRGGTALARAGVMFRDSTAAGSRFVGVFLSPGGNVIFQRRGAVGGQVITSAVRNAAGPVWLRLVRTGNTYQAFFSRSVAQPAVWTRVGSATVGLAAVVRAGVAVAAGGAGRLGTAMVERVSITTARPG